MPHKHTNTGNCIKCREIMYRYTPMNETLACWFFTLQEKHPEAHVSCAGRGRADQQAAKARGSSRASWGSSAHNYGQAIDLFVNKDGKNIYDKEWFDSVVGLAVEGRKDLSWYGRPGSRFYELPHVEIHGWRKLPNLQLVESRNDA